MKDELRQLIDECANEIDDIQQRIDSLDPLNKEKLYLTCYALIRASGVAEFVFRSIVADFFSTLGDSRIDQYFDKAVRQGSMSVKYGVICDLLGKFDEKWSRDFKAAVREHEHSDRIREASNSLVQNRHQFAHGKSPTATFSDIKAYYFDVLEIINILDCIVNEEQPDGVSAVSADME